MLSAFHGHSSLFAWLIDVINDDISLFFPLLLFINSYQNSSDFLINQPIILTVIIMPLSANFLLFLPNFHQIAQTFYPNFL
ncbi:hypothetical protein B0680_07900 [Moraxella pluranimalium]|uniref:Uncharacterized protein n=1 Tax=Moraxella pluranimalium TaxID=470453 RepID=A0A1T0CLP3_9GAMM|nr:hypothetical protein B0680_07900 [Moraxella pluranimalium]